MLIVLPIDTYLKSDTNTALIKEKYNKLNLLKRQHQQQIHGHIQQ